MKFTRLLAMMMVKGLIVLAMAWSRSTAQTQREVGSPAASDNQPRLVVQLGHSSQISTLEFSQDGRYALTGSTDHTACLFDAASGREIKRLVHASPVWLAKLSPDTRYVVTLSHSSPIQVNSKPVYTLRLWDLTTDRVIKDFSSDQESAESITFTTKGIYFSTLDDDWTPRIRDLDSGHVVFKLTFLEYSTPGADSGPSPSSIQLSSDGRYLLMGLSDHVRVWDVKTARKICDIALGYNVREVMFLADFMHILTLSADNGGVIWSTANGQIVQKFRAGCSQRDF